MKVISCFAGIGGFDLGFEQGGMETVAQIEWDKNCNKVLATHWPGVPRWGDIREVDPADLPAADVICGGFPCQDLSVAGCRAGLAGERSGLFYEFMRLVAGIRPDWVVIENVPGLLSSNGGRDMGAVVGTLGDIGYWWAYRSLDAQYFGVAQRRERVFIVGHLRSRTAASQVLFESESCAGDSAPSRGAGKGTADGVGAGVGSVSETLKASGGFKCAADHETYIPVTHTLRAEGFDGSEDGTGRGVPLVVPTLTGNGDAHSGYRDDSGLVAAFNPKMGARAHGIGYAEQQAPTLGAELPTPAILHENIGGNLASADHARALRSGASHNYQTVHTASSVRRLTPTECERLQGFPDNWTAGHADGPRYRMLGNAVCVNVSRWIGKRIVDLAMIGGK